MDKSPPPCNIQQVSLSGKIILVTGASSGIGAAISKLLAKSGARVCICARRIDKLKAVGDAIRSEGGESYEYDLDVTQRDQFTQVVKGVEETLGPIDVLINNAGVMFYTHMHNAMAEDWDKMIDVNCRGVTNGIACVLPRMVSRESGHIVNMSSDAGRKGFPGLTVYSGTKFFVEGICQGLRQEVKDKGIRVTSIQPGDCQTEIFDSTKDHDACEKYATVGSGKILNPDDIARAVLYALTQPEHVGVNEVLVEPREIPV